MTLITSTSAVSTGNPVVYDPFTDEFQADPFSVYARLRKEAPVYYNEKWDFYALSTFEDVRTALHDSETYLSFQGVDIDDFEQEQSGFPGMLPNIDNPRHDKLRSVVQRSFMPRSIRALTDEVREVCDRLIDAWGDRIHVDLSAEYAWAIPFEVFYNFLGLPDGEIREKFVRWTHGIKDRRIGTPELTEWARTSSYELREYLAQLLRDRRENPQDDVLTAIVQAEIDGEPLAPDDIEYTAEATGVAFALYLGGVETTAGNISTLLEQLARHPEQLVALRRDRSLITRAVEETLRYRTIFQVTARTTSKEVKVRDTVIPAGKRVFLILGSANRDETVWDDAEEFDILREPKPHLGFGEGLHGCLGNPLARLESNVALEQLLARCDGFSLTGEPRRYVTTPNAYVLDRVPAELDSPARPAGTPEPAETMTESDLASDPESGRCPVPYDPQASSGGTCPVPRDSASAPEVEAAAGSQAALFAEHPDHEGEIPVIVSAAESAADDVVSLRLEPVADEALPAWDPGAHIDLLLETGEGIRFERHYSLHGDPADRSAYHIAVLREPDGRGGSAYVHDHLRLGSRLRMRGPRNHFRLSQAQRYHFVAGGIGITPIRAMIRAVEAVGRDWVLDYCGRSATSMALKEELIGYGSKVRFWAKDKGHRMDLASMLSRDEPGTAVYACGPTGLIDALEEFCSAHLPEVAFHTERFTPKDFSDLPDEEFEIQLATDGRRLTVPADRTALEVLEEAGMQIISSCREGTCGTCETGVLDGAVQHRDSILSSAEQEKNDCMMVCVSRAQCPLITLDL